jgi:hypothetical protein
LVASSAAATPSTASYSTPTRRSAPRAQGNARGRWRRIGGARFLSEPGGGSSKHERSEHHTRGGVGTSPPPRTQPPHAARTLLPLEAVLALSRCPHPRAARTPSQCGSAYAVAWRQGASASAGERAEVRTGVIRPSPYQRCGRSGQARTPAFAWCTCTGRMYAAGDTVSRPYDAGRRRGGADQRGDLGS